MIRKYEVTRAVLLFTVLNVNFSCARLTYPERVTAGQGISNVNKIGIEDVTFDGNKDFVAVGPRTLSTIRQRSDGTFRDPVDFGMFIQGSEAVDFLNEGNTQGAIILALSRDGITGGSPVGSIQLVREDQNGNPVFATLVPAFFLQEAMVSTEELNGRDVKCIDMNGDGSPDIVATVSGRSFTGEEVGFLLYLENDGNGNFPVIEVIAEDLEGSAVLDVDDFDADGNLDIAVLGIDVPELRVFYKEDTGSFTSVVIDANPESNYALCVGRFDDNETVDIFTVGVASMHGYLGTTNARDFTKNPLFQLDADNLSNDYRNWQIKFHDVNDDGYTDILLIYGLQSGVKWIQQVSNDGRVEVLPPRDLLTVGAPSAFAVEDADGDGLADIVVHSDLDDAVYLFLAVEVIATESPTVAPSPPPTQSPTVASSLPPTQSPVGPCVGLNEACQSNDECCGNSICRGQCRRFIPPPSDDKEDQKLSNNGRQRGGIPGTRVLKGSRH